MLARALQADIITTDVSLDAVQRLGYGDVRIRSLGKTVKLPPFNRSPHHFYLLHATFPRNTTSSYFLEIGRITQPESIIPTCGTATRR